MNPNEIVKQIDHFDATCEWLFNLQERYDLGQWLACTPDDVLSQDYAACMRNAMLERLGSVLFNEHRGVLNQMLELL